MTSNAIKGTAWFVACIFCSDISDIIAKYLGQDMHFCQITFSKFFFSILSILPFVHNKINLRTKIIRVHFARGALLYIVTLIWFYGLKLVQFNAAIAISFSIPLFNILLSFYLLKESITKTTIFAILTSLTGTIIILDLQNINAHPAMLIMLLSSVIYAYLDILNKKFSTQESIFNMMFYSNLFGAALALIPSVIVWKTPSSEQLMFMFILGISESLFLYCILKAFTMENLSFFAPFYYIELIIAAILGYMIFKEIPETKNIIGGLIILVGATYATHNRVQNAKQRN